MGFLENLAQYTLCSVYWQPNGFMLADLFLRTRWFMIRTEEKAVDRLSALALQLKHCEGIQQKLNLLDQDSVVSAFFLESSWLKSFTAGLAPECALVIKSLVAIEQIKKFSHQGAERLRMVISDLLPVERFYQELGGIVGYQAMVLQRLAVSEGETEGAIYHTPPGVDITHMNDQVSAYILEGLRAMPQMAEIYPVGGAADRLRLYDPATGVALPAAKLPFLGRTLLEGLVRDLQAREYLYYKEFREQVFVPIAMMTSQEKENHAHVLSICQEKNWFGRSPDLFAFFSQPLVPVVDRQGEWCFVEPGKVLLKPGGHGAIWKVAADQGIFDWLTTLNKKKLLVRQINNPIAGCDYGLLGFVGVGCKEGKDFGFSSCLRQINAAEGVNVLIEKEKEFCLTNIEYCDFSRFNIEDVPTEAGGYYSKFPSNTNILFADIESLIGVMESVPLPGLVLNLKKTSFQDGQGECREEEAGRLESMMQNIADCFVYKEGEFPRSFLTYNRRSKTISTAKREYQIGSSLLETPEGCYLDYLRNIHELLSRYCGFELPYVLNNQGEPCFHCDYHPALGPLYSIIQKKLKGGRISEGSEWRLEIAEIHVENLTLEGSLIIEAEQVLGHKDSEGVLIYSEQVGKCILKNVSVSNRGIDRSAPNVFWKNEVARKESCKIFLFGNSEFIAEGVVFQGNFSVEVPAGYRMRAVMREGKLELERTLL